MDADTTLRLLMHRGHDVLIVTYGASDENVTLECHDCMEVILTQDIDADLEAEMLRISGDSSGRE
jgi:hypothetical protein